MNVDALRTLPLRLHPGEDLRASLEACVAGEGGTSAFVLSGIGSLSTAQLRFADAPEPTLVDGPTELVSLSGTVAANGSHLHAVLARADGTVVGGHVARGCLIRTTAELLVGLLDGWAFERTLDAVTGYEELVVRRVR